MRNAFRVRLHGDQCVYCGERADSDEHFPPASYGNLGFLLPACRECNSFAGTAHPLNFIERVAFVKERIKSHAPRFTFTTDVTLQDILARPERVWLAEMRAEKRKALYRSRFNWDALAYIATIQTRRYKFLPDMTEESEDVSEDDFSPQEDFEQAYAGLSEEAKASRLAMEAAHREELLGSLIESLPTFSTRRKAELLSDSDKRFLEREIHFGDHLTQKQFESLLVCARREEIGTRPQTIRDLSDIKLINLLKSVGLS